MQTTEYFRNKVMLKRPYLKQEWIEFVLENPLQIVYQDDSRIQHWAFIEEIGKYIRVVTLDDGLTVHNAFPDRDFKLIE